jgi:hypothetical protein
MKKFRPGSMLKSGIKLRPRFYLPPRYATRKIDIPVKKGIEMNPFALIKNLFKKGKSNA